MKKILTAAIILSQLTASKAQTTIFNEDFTTGGTGWTLNVNSGTNATSQSNQWEINASEGGVTPPGCGVANNGNNTLHITCTSLFCGSLITGAVYNASNITNKRAESPFINTTGYSSLTLTFNFISNGDGPFDNASVLYNSGSGWNTLSASIKSSLCGSGAGQWTVYSVSLPSSCNNISNLKIGFNWTNNADNIGTDPSVAIDDVKITAPTPFSLNSSQANVLCNGQCTGSATVTPVGGVGPFTYSWSPSGGTNATANSLCAGTYTCRAIDANSVIATSIVTITQPTSAVASSTAVTNVSCNGGANGTATVTATGGTPGYSYLWSTAATTSVITGLNAGVRTVTITDANSCTTINIITITQPSAITATQSQTNITCVNSNGFASVSPSGGTGTYTYSWTPSASTSSISAALTAGNYTCFITDANSCVLSKTFAIVTNTTAPLVSITGIFQVCIGQSAVLTANGASTYTWNTSATSNSILASPFILTTYSVVGTNSVNGCSASATHTLMVNTSPTITVNSGAICSGQSFTMIPSGAASYSFSSGSAVVSPTSTSSYSVTGTSSVGCVSAFPVVSSVTVNAAPTLTVNSGVICRGQTFTITPSGASTYTFQGGSSVVSPTSSASYTVVGTSTAGCISSSVTSSVTVNPLPVVTANSFSAACSGSTGCLSSAGASTYNWVGPCGFTSTQQSPCFPFNLACQCVYSVTGIDVNGCANTATVCLNINSTPTVSATLASSVICGPPFQGTATINASGATTYTWNTSATGSSIVVSPSITTTYTVTGTDVNGCYNTAIITQSVDACTGLRQMGGDSSGLEVYPNPNNGVFNVYIKNISSTMNVSILNVIGQVVFSQKINNVNTEIDLKEFGNGIYFIVVEGKDYKKTTKIVKQ